MMEIVLITKLLWRLHLSEVQRREITACTLYNVKKSHKVDLYDRLNRCKNKVLKEGSSRQWMAERILL